LIKKFYEDYSHINSVRLEEAGDHKSVAAEIQNQIDSFIREREQKKLDEIEMKRILESLILQKQREEAEELARKQAAEEAEKAAAAEAEAQRQLEAKKAQEALESII
jgi:hypothetical protein